ncbi:MAG: calcium-binding protein [Candidatus Paceibacterota bacterium]
MPRKHTSPARFSPDDAVHVKSGVTDPDYPDIPIGGWAGQVAEIEAGNPPCYLVRWSRQTLDSMAAVYRNRCERDGLDIKEMWLAEDYLEPDTGQRVEIEQPTNIQTEPLNMKDQDDRIRAIFGLTHDDPVPEVDPETLRTYRDYLAEHLSFPFEAQGKPGPRRFSSKRRTVTVIGLGSPDEDERLDEHYGLICEIKIDRKRGDAPLAELEVSKRGSERQLVEDYRYWFSNWR